MAPRVLVTGGSGSIGVLLCEYLEGEGYEVSILSRKKRGNSKYKTFIWNYKDNFIENGAFVNCDFIVHLAGAGIANKPWTKARKKEIIDSRVKTTRLIYNTLSACEHQVKGVVSASAVGFYGQVTTSKTYKEDDPSGTDYLASVCKLWEDEVNRFNDLDIRTVSLRIGLVLMKTGGALEKMLLPFKMNVGTALGTGKQIIPWIHIADLNRIILQSIQLTSMNSAYNCCAPEPTDNLHFSKAIAKKLNKKMWLTKAPSTVLKLILGERSILLTEGSKVSSDKIIQTGFNFKYSKLEPALDDLL